MKIILYVFSGTGNTLAVAHLYKKFLEQYNKDNYETDLSVSVDIYRVSAKSGKFPSPENYDIIGVGYPIHAFVAPEPIVKFCKNLPKVKGKRTFIFKTSGEGLHINDCSSQKCLKILTKKGYDVVMERHIVMPYNMIYRHNDLMAKQMWIYAHALTDLNSRELLTDKREKVKRTFLKTMWVAPIGWVEQHFAHMHGTAFKVNAKKCIGCNKCVNICPQNNIKVEDGKYKFGHDCVLCMGCSFGCPKDAIKVGAFKYWKVNGSYRLNELKADKSIIFPYVPNRAKGIYRLYKKYYRECDRKLLSAGINVNDYI